MSDFGTTREGPADVLGGLIRHALKVAMVARGLSEDGLAKELSIRSGRAINAGLIHAWTAESKHKWRMPADLIPFVCEILEDDTILRLIMNPKQRECQELGESVPRIVSLLRSALKEARTRTKR
jgi:hypothetical protein